MLQESRDFDDRGQSHGSDEGESLSAGLRTILDVIRRRYRTLLGVAIAVFAFAVVLVMLITPKYEAQVRLKIDPSQGAVLGQATSTPSLPDQSVVETEVTVMSSREIVTAVVRKLNLLADPEFSKGADPMPAKPSAADIDARVDYVATQLLGAMTAEREKATYIIDLGVRSTNPVKAATIANALADEYLDSSVNRRSGTAEKQSAFLDKRLSELGTQAQQADAEVAKFRADGGTVEEGATATDAQISALAMQYSTAQSDAAAARSKYNIANHQVASGGLDNVSAVLGSEVIANLRSQRAQLVTQQGLIATRYGPKHPETQRVQQQISDIDAQIEAEAKRVVGSLGSEASAADARASSLAGDLAKLRGQKAGETKSSVMAAGMARKADTAHTAYNQLAAAAQQTDQVARNSIAQAQIVERASPPDQPSAPKKKLLLAAAFLFALAIGGGTITTQEMMAAGFRSKSEIEHLGLPFLGSIPKLRGRQLLGPDGTKMSPAETLLAMPMTAYAEVFRNMRSSLLLSSDHVPTVIALASSLPNEGKTNSALTLARVMALSGDKTLVIDADLRRAGMRSLTGGDPKIGLLEVLQDQALLRDAVMQDAVPNLSVLPVATPSFTAADMFGGPEMRQLLETLRGQYDRIVIDTPPLLGVADARTIAAMADAVVMVARWNETPRSAVKSALSWLYLDKANIAGVALTMVDPAAEAMGALYYSRHYANYYQSA